MANCGQSEKKKIPKEITKGLMDAFEDDPETCARVLYFLSQSVAADCAEPYIDSLTSALPNAMTFKKFAERMAKDTKTLEQDPNFRQQMYDMWNDDLKDVVKKHPDGGSELSLAIQLKLQENDYAVATFCFLDALSYFPPEVVRMIAAQAERMGGQIAVMGGKSVDFMLKPAVRVALVTAILAWDVIKNINRWWSGEISGKRCVKNIIDCGVGVAAGVVGGMGGRMAGGVIGSVFGPIGTACGMVVGGVVCGIVAAHTAETLFDALTNEAFGLPKDEALENAHVFLGVSSNTSNSDVNSQYRRLARKYHPDKGGNAEKWRRLQYSMAIIRAARGEP